MKLRQTKKYKGRKYISSGSVEVEDILAVEEALQININGKAYTVTMRTPGHEIALVRGLLYTENIYRGKQPLQYKVLEETDEGYVSIVNVWLDPIQMGEGYNTSRSMISVAACGICGKREIKDIMLGGEKLQVAEKLDPSDIQGFFRQMRSKQKGFELSGGCHAAAIFDKNGQMLTIMEDIGRHNAVDKVIGALLESDQLDQAHSLLVSGRISYEIVSKTYKAGIAYLAAVSAPSSLAVDCAEEMGICILAFCRGDKLSCYSNISFLNESKLELNEA